GGHQQKFGISRFRVLTLCTSERRKENLRELAKYADDRKQGSAMFMFASEQSFSIDDPETILKPIWQTPVDDTWYNILG
ncbi:MAG: hypothetical protein ACE5KO_05735, partial [Candidatus Bathyarchaeia archaeon]